ncbi:MAG: molybdopterin converting factor [Pirellula sp.]|nr:molybdopterin converting factor [Pirellula sp.]
MKILFIDATGAGFASPIEVAEGTTVGTLFLERIGGDPKAFLIRVNRQSATVNQVLQPGDRVSITPLKIEGAAA